MPTKLQTVQEQTIPMEPKAELLEWLDRADLLLEQIGPDFAEFREQLSELQSRLADEKFHLAVLGQFKRGKSTLVNALLGVELLPTSAVPVTAIPTVISGDRQRSATIHFLAAPDETRTFDDDAELAKYIARYVTEQGNPDNRFGVSRVELFHPAPFLQAGVTLIDTPGIGSTLAHNTEMTMNYLEHCDAALFVISADPPITAGEVEFLQAVEQHVQRIFIVLNKVDYLSPQDQQEVAEFVQKVLQQRNSQQITRKLYRISARQGLMAKCGKHGQDGGLSLLEAEMQRFFQAEKSQVLMDAVRAKALGVLQAAAMEQELLLKALEMPLNDLANRQQLLEKSLEQILQQQRIAGDLLAGDRNRALLYLEEQADELRAAANQFLLDLVLELIKNRPLATVETEAHERLAAAIPHFFETELAKTANRFQLHMEEIFTPHRQRAEALVNEVRQAAARIFEIEYRASAETESFQMKRQPYWVKDEWRVAFGEIPEEWVDRLLPERIRLERIKKRLQQHVEMLVTRNVENLRWATLQNVEMAFLVFGEDLKRRIASVVEGTRKAIAAALALKVGQQESLQDSTHKHRAIARELQALITAGKEG